MIIVVNDANILIDLLKIDLCDQFFQLNFEFNTSDFIMAEVKEPNVHLLNQYVKRKKLLVRHFGFEEITEIIKLNQEYNKLSLADCSCLILCQKLNAILLTGERQLTRIAEKTGIETHGCLWIFEQLILKKVISYDLAINKLESLVLQNTRLPENECRKYLQKWRNIKKKGE